MRRREPGPHSGIPPSPRILIIISTAILSSGSGPCSDLHLVGPSLRCHLNSWQSNGGPFVLLWSSPCLAFWRLGLTPASSPGDRYFINYCVCQMPFIFCSLLLLYGELAFLSRLTRNRKSSDHIVGHLGKGKSSRRHQELAHDGAVRGTSL